MRFLFLLLLLAWMACATHGASAAGRVALVVGNARYSDAVGPLVNPERDAELVAGALAQRGFTVIKVLNTDRVAMLSALDRYARTLRAAGPGSIGFFYYSGHGVANPETRRNYIVPVDAQSAGDDRLWYQSIPLDDVVRTVTESARGATNLIVFDACRDQLALPKQRGLGGTKGLERIEAQESTLIAYSTAPNKTAADTDASARTGPYATELAKALAVPNVDVRTMFENVKFGVLARTARKQQPWVEDGLADRIFLGGTPSDVAISPLISGYQPPASVPSPIYIEAAPALSGSTDPAEEAYTNGFRLWQARSYKEAQAQLKLVVERYPQHRRASFAQHLLGRTYLDGGFPSLASSAFYNSYKKMPAGERASDSLYYLAQALLVLGKKQDACKVYDELLDVYGKTMVESLRVRATQGKAEINCK